MSTEDDITAAMFEDAGLTYQAPTTDETVETTEEVNSEETETELVAEMVNEGDVVTDEFQKKFLRKLMIQSRMN